MMNYYDNIPRRFIHPCTRTHTRSTLNSIFVNYTFVVRWYVCVCVSVCTCLNVYERVCERMHVCVCVCLCTCAST
jgi:hypothetical protein